MHTYRILQYILWIVYEQGVIYACMDFCYAIKIGYLLFGNIRMAYEYLFVDLVRNKSIIDFVYLY